MDATPNINLNWEVIERPDGAESIHARIGTTETLCIKQDLEGSTEGRPRYIAKAKTPDIQNGGTFHKYVGTFHNAAEAVEASEKWLSRTLVEIQPTYKNLRHVIVDGPHKLTMATKPRKQMEPKPPGFPLPW